MDLSADSPTVGVVGGGQLGRMLAEAGSPLGVQLVVSDPTPDCPANHVAREQLVGAFDDGDTLRALAERADVLTYEIELADPDALDAVSEQTGTPVHPAPDTLRTIQDKLVQNETFAEAGLPLPAFRRVDDADDLRAAGEELGWPVMVKARTGGYDGRGNVPVDSPDEAETALDEIGANNGGAVVEELVAFERELAVIGARGSDETVTFPVTETVQREEILRESLSPARTDEETRERARAVARSVLDELDGRGVFGIELFEREQEGGPNEILLNEVAPRPHNSGHWSIEGCVTSQFEQHVRAVVGLPLGSTRRRGPTASANVLGEVAEPTRARLTGVDEALAATDAHLHWYGKREVRPLRKMGHVTAVGESEPPLSAVREAVETLGFAADRNGEEGRSR
ncbi:5-(carboxyamino)imidazole ribonucleotide synthase [Halobacteriales archaeon SW_6_65_46]|nr:MAG: 5-(carboxyamino)imidazole ribonucleotide synthase [Halobacteriales archaeon SW_6_65_46]